MKKTVAFFLSITLSFYLISQNLVDTSAINKIRNEGLNNSAIEDIAFQMIDMSGPRLMNSPGYYRAMDLAVQQLESWGATNVEKQAFGEYGKGWAIDKSYIAMKTPYYMPFIAIPQAWTGSTKGLINQKIVFPKIESEEDFEKYRGKLSDAIVVLPPPLWALDIKGDASPTFEPDANRFTAEELEEMKNPMESESRWSPQRLIEIRVAYQLSQKIDSFLLTEDASLVLQGSVGKHGTIFTRSRGDGRDMDTKRSCCC